VSEPAADSFSRYLRAKKSVDDRSINLGVYQKMLAALTAGNRKIPLTILETGCGLGTMIERLWDWNLTDRAVYTAIDREPGLIAEAGMRLREFARSRQLAFSEAGGAIRLRGARRDWLVRLTDMDFFTFCREQQGHTDYDLVLAHAFLDLVDLPTGLPGLLSLLKPGGLYYFTLTYDGETIFYPPVDQEFEDLVIKLYHQTMDRRTGGTSGHSQTGRRLLAAVGRYGSEILAAGSSDWLVWPQADGSYPAEEAYFLDYLLETIHQALAGHPDLDQQRFQAWLAGRRDQIQAGELIFMAHQWDVCGRV
jgi:SAM-dependent methyltransferase